MQIPFLQSTEQRLKYEFLETTDSSFSKAEDRNYKIQIPFLQSTEQRLKYEFLETTDSSFPKAEDRNYKIQIPFLQRQPERDDTSFRVPALARFVSFYSSRPLGTSVATRVTAPLRCRTEKAYDRERKLAREGQRGQVKEPEDETSLSD
ncbi:hypothetical protein K0M31_007464 [Melipona bicolor]|uniref:Uncharacterized protein n=1 Tax=Melipona bicolor TaxID=60889 RepID=A0AA40KVU0_9HYME|nr:hypothetical protein K0M31_007464 [Melipona bicolor]